jgi:UrcA family protein
MNTKTFHYTKQVTLAAVAALCLSSVAAYAGEGANEVQSRTVRYTDLDVGTPAGATALHSRIRQAAEQVCGDPSSRQLAEATAAKACITQAILASEESLPRARFAANR